ncbi:uncharacterized protein OCT59_009158 [Rhizophagus irregularis]|uniref:uncharacterized protein n=1 Tax=Rhizophagus irregularis TaxID=588596 RepID=UPI000CCA2538|nr:hypothetical protein OCT59_009158 [Rhizophagus irregularis]GBC24515.1 hypothetical protein GLOIN_2v1556410 [Rhizophagus irregularis DAOM 181602=DAOM 197198]
MTSENENVVVHTWEDVKEIVESGRLELFYRSKSEQLRYRAYRERIKKEYGSLDNYIYQNVLNWPKESSPNDPSLQEYFSSKIPSTHYNLRLNDFPYTIDSSISHYVLWSRLPFRDPNDRNVKDDINLFLKENFPGNEEWLFFINPPQLQSIKNIWHGHIFVRDILNTPNKT